MWRVTRQALSCSRALSRQQQLCSNLLARNLRSNRITIGNIRQHSVCTLQMPVRRVHNTSEPSEVASGDIAQSATDGPHEREGKRKLHKRTLEDLEAVVQAVRDDNCLDVVTIDVRQRTPQCDFFVIVTCRAGRHMNAVAEMLSKQFKDRRRRGNPVVVEGDADSQWIIVNMTDIQVHLLDAVMRERLELEKLWTLGPDDDQLRDLIDSQPEYFI